MIQRSKVHEAGHAAVCRALGAPTPFATVGALNAVKPDLRNRTLCERVAALSAGYLAEYVAGLPFRGEAWKWKGSDLWKIHRMALLDSVGPVLEAWTEGSIDSEAAADQMLEREGRKVDDALEAGFAAAELILRARWGQVRRVADWLGRAGALDQPAIDAAMAGAAEEIQALAPTAALDLAHAAAGVAGVAEDARRLIRASFAAHRERQRAEMREAAAELAAEIRENRSWVPALRAELVEAGRYRASATRT